MQLLKGSKKEFDDFISKINGNVAILTHNDLDGISSALFLSIILEKKGIKPKFIEFQKYRNDALKSLEIKIKNEKISFLFILDFSIDSLDLFGFNDLRKKINVFLIDHHPSNPLLNDFSNIIKTKSEDCATYTIWSLADKEISKEWNFLLCSTMISEFSYNDPINFEFMRTLYPNLIKEEILKSEPGEYAMKISSLLSYYSNNVSKAYKIISEKNDKDLVKIHNIIEKELVKRTKEFLLKKEEYGDLIIYKIKLKYSILSNISTTISMANPKKTIILIANDDTGYNKLSARNQSKNIDMGKLLKLGIQNLENANAGGHVPAAGGRIMEKDYETFKKNIINGYNKLVQKSI